MQLIAAAPPTFTALHLLSEAGIEFTATTDPAEFREADVIVMAPRYGSLLRGLDAPHLKWIHALGAGVDTFPFDELSGITITNSRGLYADALAEFVIGAMLSFAKDFPRLLRNQAAHRWEPFINERLEGKTIGIIGFGGTGRAIARRADAMAMKIITSRRSAADPRAFEADYVVLCVPLTSETRGMMSSERIARMPPHSVLINVSRGAVVDERALVAALCDKKIRGAALDVFATEPLPPGHTLWTLDNVLISPHTADRATDSHERAMRFFIENLRRFERGDELQNVVDPRAQY
jgi:phosphoglycerate dehydrogenase-like enzyme